MRKNTHTTEAREMVRGNFLAMKTDHVSQDIINSDMNKLKMAATNLIADATRLGGLGFGTSFLKWVATFAAMSVSLSFDMLHCFSFGLS